MNVQVRDQEIDMMVGKLEEFGHSVLRQSHTCLVINGAHHHQANLADTHAYMSGFLAASEAYEWRDVRSREEVDSE